METIGVGIDIVDIGRIRSARYLARAAEFFFLPAELADMRASRDQAQFMASRLALKEAIIKAMPERLWYHDMCLQKEGEKIVVQLQRPLEHQYRILVSVAHELSYAVGYATVCR